MTVIAFLTDPKVVTRILEHLELPSAAPVIAESRVPVKEEAYCEVPAYDDVVSSWDGSQDTGPPDARAPP